MFFYWGTFGYLLTAINKSENSVNSHNTSDLSMLLGKQGEIVNLSATDVYFSGSEYEKKTIFIVNFYTFCFSG